MPDGNDAWIVFPEGDHSDPRAVTAPNRTAAREKASHKYAALGRRLSPEQIDAVAVAEGESVEDAKARVRAGVF